MEGFISFFITVNFRNSKVKITSGTSFDLPIPGYCAISGFACVQRANRGGFFVVLLGCKEVVVGASVFGRTAIIIQYKVMKKITRNVQN